MRLFSVTFVLLAACGGGSDTPSDAAIDAPVDARPDAPPPPPNTYRFVVTQQKMPTSNNQARAYGLDLDNDAVVDNQLGMVIATFAGQGIEVQADADRAVKRGEIIQLLELGADSFTTTTLPGSIALFRGQNPSPAACANTNDTVCGHHLTGSGSFDAAATPRNPPLTGAVTASTFTAGPGALQLDTTLLGGKISVELIGARVKIAMLANNMLGDGVLAGAITTTERDTKLYPQMQQSVQAIITRDCTNPGAPDCGCAASSQGKSYQGLFDTTPKDCMVTITEIQDNSLIQSLFAPDVMIDNQQALSVGIGFTATHAGFVP